LETFKSFALLTNNKDVFEKLRDDIKFINSKDLKIEDLLNTPEINDN
jgi:hypothetical protein